MIGRAFAASAVMGIIHWGDTLQFKGVSLTQPSDGIVNIETPVSGFTIPEHLALVEIKNRREWPYHGNYMIWKLIRNAYKLDMVGIYFSRRIPKSTFWYCFKSIGAVGVETFNQFAPPQAESALSPVKHKLGLGYHDLYFSDAIPEYLQRQIDNLPDRILAARTRMKNVREIVEPYLEQLATRSVIDPQRRELLESLNSEIRDYDTPEEEEESDETDDAYEAYADDKILERLELERDMPDSF